MDSRTATCLSVLSLFSLTCVAAAQVAVPGLDVRTSHKTGLAQYITAAGGGPITVAAKNPTPTDFLAEHGSVFGLASLDQFVLHKAETDNLGWTHTTFTQVHRGVPVFAGMIKVHQDAAGGFVGANGNFYPVSDKLAVFPTLTANMASNAVLALLADAAAASVETCTLVVVDPGWYGDAPTGPRLAYHVIAGDGAAVRVAVFIDAHSGEVLDRWSMICHILDRLIYDGAGGAALPGTLARSEGDAAAADVEVNMGYDYAGDTYRYFNRAFGRDGIDGFGMPIRITANSTAPNCPNAYWNGSRCVFCTGVMTDDVLGHEIAHGVTQFSAGLIYQNQSGQLNESYSDVFGEMVDQFNGDASAAGAPGGIAWPDAPQVGPGTDVPNEFRVSCSPRPEHPDGVRWLMGEDSSAFGGAIRDMYFPTCRNHPDRAFSAFMTCPGNDSGGVHSGSGVPNHAFALLTDGGTFNGRTIVGIGAIKSGAVWYRALTVYLNPSSDFRDAYTAFSQSAADLVGTFPNDPRTGLPSGSMFTLADAAQLDEALLATEMNTDGACGQTADILSPAPPLECADRAVIFADDFESQAGSLWTVSNSGPPTPYDWVRTAAPLPFGRPGIAWYCEDRNIGDCATQVEAATHVLTSPPIVMPTPLSFPMMSFTHYIGSEAGFDGGNLKVSINGGPFTLLGREAFLFNPYSSLLKTAGQNNDAPIAGEPAWTGTGGQWGTSLLNLTGLVSAGDTVQFRFEFGKDGCTGGAGWYVDDFSVYECPDCDGNSAADVAQFVHRASTGYSGNIGNGSPQTLALAGLPTAAGDVRVEFAAIGDLSAAVEYLDVDINGVGVGRVFETGGADCPNSSGRAVLTIPASTFNDAVALGGGGAAVNLVATADVNASLCVSWAAMHVQYPLAAADADGDFILDACEAAPCPADFNLDGQRTIADIFAMLGAWFANDARADANNNTTFEIADVFVFLGIWFAGC